MLVEQAVFAVLADIALQLRDLGPERGAGRVLGIGKVEVEGDDGTLADRGDKAAALLAKLRPRGQAGKEAELLAPLGSLRSAVSISPAASGRRGLPSGVVSV